MTPRVPATALTGLAQPAPADAHRDPHRGDDDGYGVWLHASGGLAASSIRTYTAHTRDFQRWWQGTRPDRATRDAEPGDIQAYLAALAARGCQPATRRLALHALRSYYRWLLSAPLPLPEPAPPQTPSPATNPAALVRRPRVPPPRTTAYSEHDADRILAATTAPAHRGSHSRDIDEDNDEDNVRGGVGRRHGELERAVLATLRYTGLRASELCGLTVSALDLPGRQLHVLGKGSKPRTVPLTAGLHTTLLRYLLQVRPQLHADTSTDRDDEGSVAWLLINPRGRTGQLTGQALLDICRRNGLAAAVTGPHTAVRWRHSFATHTLARGVDLHVLARLLGHARVATTERYLHLSTAALEGALTRAYPTTPNPAPTVG